MIILKAMSWESKTINIVKRFPVAFSSQDKIKGHLCLTTRLPHMELLRNRLTEVGEIDF